MMAEKEVRSTYPLAPANGHARSNDTEATHDEAERQKKRRKLINFIAFFIISNVVINTIMALTILKARNPRFRVREATVATFNGTNASLSLQFFVKNTNFGRYKYGNTTVAFMQGATSVGEVHVPNAKVGWRATRKFNVSVSLDFNDQGVNVIPIMCVGKLRGNAAIMFMMKKKRSADMNCTMEIVRETLKIHNLVCK